MRLVVQNKYLKLRNDTIGAPQRVGVFLSEKGCSLFSCAEVRPWIVKVSGVSVAPS